jgi:hypothetical protein
MIVHAVSFLATAVAKMPTLIGSSWGGVVFTLFLLGLGEFAFLVGGKKWRWDRDTAIGVGLAAVGWGVLFCLSAFLSAYGDHQNLVGATARIKRELNRKVQDGKDEIGALRVSCANQQGKNETLENQNRDEQILISGCQNQAMKLLTPEPEKHTPTAFEVDHSNPARDKSRWLVFTNKIVTTTQMVVTCDQDIDDLAAKVDQIQEGQHDSTRRRGRRVSVRHRGDQRRHC